MKLGAHTLKTWATTQAIVALSSGEAEYYGLVKGASHLLGMIALFKDLGINMVGRIFTDSTAAKGIASRMGLGKTRHIAVHLLWIQEKVRNKDFELLKVKGTENPADLMTKHLSQEVVNEFTNMWGAIFSSGRSDAAPQCVV